MQIRLESCSPFLVLPFQEWRPCYVRVQGTMLCIYKLKTSHVDKMPVHSAGRLIKKYTLQHAEVGLALDVSHSVLVPMTRLASLIPPLARRKAFEKDPELFTHERHCALRVRSELDQFVLSNKAEEQVISWVNHISAGIDIAPDLDSRNTSRQCTMPRRSRRHRTQEVQDLTDARLIEQQRRLLAQYPSLADNAPPTQTAPEDRQSEQNTAIAQIAIPSRVEIAAIIPDQEQEDIDLSELAEEAPERRNVSVSSAADRLSASRANSQTLRTAGVSRSNFDENGKWMPPHPRTAAQQWRYIRRCMPVLMAETPRHSSVMIDNGRYVRPNYKHDSLEKWSLQPPTYEAHDFSEAVTKAMTSSGGRTSRRQSCSSSSAASVSENNTESSSRSDSGQSDDIRRIDSTSGSDDLVIEQISLTTGAPILDFKNFGLAQDISSDEEQRGRLQRSNLTRGATKASPNPTMREMAKPSAVLGF